MSSQPPSTQVTITELGRADVAGAVALHMGAFPDFFLTFLGRSFLRQFYLGYCGNPDTVALVARRAATGELLGTVVGPLRPAGFYKRLLLKRWWRFAWAACGAVVRKPTVIPRLFRALTYRGDAPEDHTERALLSSICVDPTAQGLGIGRQLVCQFLENIRAANLPGAFLTTDVEGNEAVNAFYGRLGWKVDSEFATPEGRRMHRYVYDFCDHPK
ncbi:MAG: GNAT family N-acetyltransferase [Planctomycetota bacterium]